MDIKAGILSTAFIFVISCRSAPDIQGFDKAAWLSAQPCDSIRIAQAELVVANEALIMGSTQPDIEALLGQAPRHELFNRNEKFFYYPIRINCDEGENQSLFIRFDALARAKEVIIVFD